MPHEYAREALKRGLAYEAKLGANPFKFGMIGSTDSHTSLATDDGGQFLRQGRRARAERRSDRFNEVDQAGSASDPKRSSHTRRMASIGGLAAVWAK